MQVATVAVAHTDEDAAAAILDHRVLDKFRERERNGRKNVLRRIISAYLKQAPSHIAQLREAISESDSAAVKSAAHALKSSSANVGAMRLSEMCLELETLGRAQVADGVAERFSELEAMFGKVCGALSAECGEKAA